jgi:hypothetical protein
MAASMRREGVFNFMNGRYAGIESIPMGCAPHRHKIESAESAGESTVAGPGMDRGDIQACAFFAKRTVVGSKSQILCGDPFAFGALGIIVMHCLLVLIRELLFFRGKPGACLHKNVLC